MHLRAIGVILGLASGVGFAAALGSPHEKALQQAVESFEKIGATLKKIVDEESAATAKPELKKSADAFVEARTAAEKLDPPDKEEKQRLEKIYKPKLEDAMKKMNTEVRRVAQIPGGKEALKEIAVVLRKDEKK